MAVVWAIEGITEAAGRPIVRSMFDMLDAPGVPVPHIPVAPALPTLRPLVGRSQIPEIAILSALGAGLENLRIDVLGVVGQAPMNMRSSQVLMPQG